MPRPARREREIARVREDILHAAAAALARHGLERATIHDIAREAGYTTTSLYAYFDGKQEILETLFARLTDELIATFSAGLGPEAGFAARLEALLRRQLEIAERWQVAFAVLSRRAFARGSGPSACEAADGAMPPQPFTEALAGWLRQARPEDLGGRDALEAARVLQGIAAALFHEWLASDRARPLADRAPAIVGWFVAGAAGFAQPSGGAPICRPAPAAHEAARGLP